MWVNEIFKRLNIVLIYTLEAVSVKLAMKGFFTESFYCADG